jgi:TRAP-type uncharacterized transport system substrate-binding protein
VKRSAARLLILLAGLHAGLAGGAERIRIFVAGAEHDAQAQMARDLGRHVARPAEIDFDIRTVAGTPEALQRLGESGTLQFALLQADAVDAYGRAARRGNGEARRLLEPVRLVMPLHEEEIHFVVRRDSPLNHMHDLAAARINLGPLRSGTALTAANLYRLMFDAAIPDAQASFLPHEEALLKLITEQSLDAVAIVGSRPVRLLANMKPEARQFVKLLKFDAAHPAAAAVLGVYGAATATAAGYPNLLEADQPTLAVRIHLAAAGQGKRSDALLARFAAAWCRNPERLKAAGAAPASLNSPAGWRLAPAVERELRACLGGERPAPEPCAQEDRLLGLCE